MPEFKAISAVMELVQAVYASAQKQDGVTKREIRAAKALLKALMGRAPTEKEVDEALAL